MVGARGRTSKVAEGIKGRKSIVHVNWLRMCIAQWRRLPETGFPLTANLSK